MCMQEKMSLWKKALEQIEADAPAERAAEAAEAAKRGSPAKGGGSYAAEEEGAERQKALQDKVTEGILGAGILECVMATPAVSLAPTAMRTGWLRKEGKGNKAFKRRYFVLWSTADALLRAQSEALLEVPNATPDATVLVYYEGPGLSTLFFSSSPLLFFRSLSLCLEVGLLMSLALFCVLFRSDSMEPKGYVVIEAGKLTAKKPKKARKGAAHCMRVDQNGSLKAADGKPIKAAQFKLVRPKKRNETRSVSLLVRAQSAHVSSVVCVCDLSVLGAGCGE